MADGTYGPKVYRKQGGDEQVVASGGKITVEDGGAIVIPLALKTDNYTVLASESGTTFKIATDAKVFTLPSTAAGLGFTFINSGADGAVLLAISPAAADAIHGRALTSVDNKDLLNTKATAKEGDTVTLVGDGVDGWFIVAVEGIWAKEA
ncbi:MAG: hypothetical protein HW375_47 [Anaerolineales bacterium]|nr:hypothetical protein [Anaerolineales bacterium]